MFFCFVLGKVYIQQQLKALQCFRTCAIGSNNSDRALTDWVLLHFSFLTIFGGKHKVNYISLKYSLALTNNTTFIFHLHCTWHHYSQTARDLKFSDNVHHPLCVMCPLVSGAYPKPGRIVFLGLGFRGKVGAFIRKLPIFYIYKHHCYWIKSDKLDNYGASLFYDPVSIKYCRNIVLAI